MLAWRSASYDDNNDGDGGDDIDDEDDDKDDTRVLWTLSLKNGRK